MSVYSVGRAKPVSLYTVGWVEPVCGVSVDALRGAEPDLWPGAASSSQ